MIINQTFVQPKHKQETINDYEKFRDFYGTRKTITYGRTSSDVKILNSKLYRLGTEATCSMNGEILTPATFEA